MFRTPAPFLAVAGCLAAASCLAGSSDLLELRGTITGAVARAGLRVQLFSVEHPYAASTPVGPGGEFRFRDLTPGDYTVAIVREGLGEIRRTIAVAPAPDGDRTVTIDIPYSASEVASGGGAGMVSIAALSIPDEAQEKYAGARQALAQRNAAKAQRLLEEATNLAPQYTLAWNALGVIAFQEGDHAIAEQHFRRALEAEPGAFEPAVNLGGLLLGAGHAQEALRHNQRAAEARPTDATAAAQLGMNLYQLGRYDEAEPYLAAAKRIDPAHHTQPQLFLAEIYRHRGDAAAAIGELEELLALRPSGAHATAVRRALASLRETAATQRVR